MWGGARSTNPISFFGVTIRVNEIISFLCEITREITGSVIGGATRYPYPYWLASYCTQLTIEFYV
jgi:hypothetical protein